MTTDYRKEYQRYLEIKALSENDDKNISKNIDDKKNNTKVKIEYSNISHKKEMNSVIIEKKQNFYEEYSKMSEEEKIKFLSEKIEMVNKKKLPLPYKYLDKITEINKTDENILKNIKLFLEKRKVRKELDSENYVNEISIEVLNREIAELKKSPKEKEQKIKKIRERMEELLECTLERFLNGNEYKYGVKFSDSDIQKIREKFGIPISLYDYYQYKKEDFERE